MVKEQYGLDLSKIQEEHKTFERTYGKALSEYKSQLVNYIASQVNYAQFQFQDYTLARIVTELYLKDSVASACIGTYQMYYPEPAKLVYEGDKEAKEGDLIDLLRKPNPWMSESDLDKYIATYQLWTGNCYLLKIYNDNGTIAQLFPFSGLNVYPVPGLYDFVDHFAFVTAEGIISTIKQQDIIHLPWLSIDPHRLFMGISPMQLCSRDIQISILMTEHVGNYAKNIALPSLVASKNSKTKPDNTVSAESLGITTAEDIKKTIKERFTGDNIGDVLIGQEDWEYSYLGFPLKDLEIDKVLKVFHCNICSNFKTDPEFIKIAAGMASSTYDNQETSKLNFFQGALSSLWAQNGNKLTNALRPNYGEDITVKYDVDSVRTLRSFKEQRLGTLIPAITAVQAQVGRGELTAEGGIATICLTMGLDRREVEPLFSGIKVQGDLSKLKVTGEGVVA